MDLQLLLDMLTWHVSGTVFVQRSSDERRAQSKLATESTPSTAGRRRRRRRRRRRYHIFHEIPCKRL